MPRGRVRLRRTVASRLYVRRGMAMRRRRGRFRKARNARTGGWVGRELKFIDNEVDATAVAITWGVAHNATTNCLFSIETGTAENNRVGRIANIVALNIRGEIILPAAESQPTPTEDHVCRLCLVLDTQTNKAEVVPGDVMKDTVANDYLTFRNLQNVSRFKVLWDRSFVFKPAQTNEGAANLFANGAIKKYFKIFKKFSPPLRLTFVGTATPPTVAQLTTNSLSMISIATSATITVSHIARARFTG